jgi:hypothetical protein
LNHLSFLTHCQKVAVTMGRLRCLFHPMDCRMVADPLVVNPMDCWVAADLVEGNW